MPANKSIPALLVAFLIILGTIFPFAVFAQDSNGEVTTQQETMQETNGQDETGAPPTTGAADPTPAILNFVPDRLTMSGGEQATVDIVIVNAVEDNSASLVISYSEDIEVIDLKEAGALLGLNKDIGPDTAVLDVAKTDGNFMAGEVLAKLTFRLLNPDDTTISFAELTRVNDVPLDPTSNVLLVQFMVPTAPPAEPGQEIIAFISENLPLIGGVLAAVVLIVVILVIVVTRRNGVKAAPVTDDSSAPADVLPPLAAPTTPTTTAAVPVPVIPVAPVTPVTPVAPVLPVAPSPVAPFPAPIEPELAKLPAQAAVTAPAPATLPSASVTVTAPAAPPPTPIIAPPSSQDDPLQPDLSPVIPVAEPIPANVVPAAVMPVVPVAPSTPVVALPAPVVPGSPTAPVLPPPPPAGDGSAPDGNQGPERRPLTPVS